VIGWNILSKENRKIVLLNLLSTIIWYFFAYTIKTILEVIKDYIMPAYIIHIGFVLIVLVLNICLCVSFSKRANRNIEQNLNKIRKDSIKPRKEPVSKESHVYDILDDCILEEDPDWFRNPITDEKFCSDCWDAYKIKKRLKKDWSNWPLPRWICPRCNKIHTSIEKTLKSIFMNKSRASVIGRTSEK